MILLVLGAIIAQIILLAVAASYGYKHGYKDCADDMAHFTPKTIIRPAGRTK